VTGAVAGTFANDIKKAEPTTIGLPAPLHWALFIPIAIVGYLGVIITATYILVTFPAFQRVLDIERVLDVEQRFLTGVVFISLAAAIAPAGRKIIVSILGGLWLISAICYAIAGIFRPAVLNVVEHLTNRELGFYSEPWIQALQGVAWIAAAAIPLIVTFRSKKPENVEGNICKPARPGRYARLRRNP
jgi:hypothetical protein